MPEPRKLPTPLRKTAALYTLMFTGATIVFAFILNDQLNKNNIFGTIAALIGLILGLGFAVLAFLAAIGWHRKK
ncbi:hypothetical protein SAMN04487820_10212 [Actinopolyspora mzabensis]|uniref:Uncharacterized protein n=1 Tax=Actinopolyspora mzabensis TaxID=995066 RepID=A0A1G8WFQ6_ACTMZ|nr:hypothetical protein SAMN04487820_10212 [Actinopolyspora mzabensis]